MTTKAELTVVEAQLWLAGLEKPCPNCHDYGAMSSQELVGIPGADPMYGCDMCNSTGKVPLLLDLRKPCLNYSTVERFGHGSGWTLEARQDYQDFCRSGKDPCQGRGWVPSTDERVLRVAMFKAGWDIFIEWMQGKAPQVSLRRETIIATDSNAWLAAAKAMKKWESMKE